MFFLGNAQTGVQVYTEHTPSYVFIQMQKLHVKSLHLIVFVFFYMRGEITPPHTQSGAAVV